MRGLRALLVAVQMVLIALVVPSTAWADESALVRQFHDAAGRFVVLREGRYDPATGSGFGQAKIVGKHKITNMAIVEKIIKNPNGGRAAGGTARHYDGIAKRFRCDISNRCTEVERIPLLAIVDFRAAPEHGNGQKGVITAYCDFGSPLRTDCPSWVNNLANVQ